MRTTLHIADDVLQASRIARAVRKRRVVNRDARFEIFDATVPLNTIKTAEKRHLVGL